MLCSRATKISEKLITRQLSRVATEWFVFIAHQKLDHLTAPQREQITAVFQQYGELFHAQTKIAKVDQHCIELKEGPTPRRPHRYRIPETLKGEVARQVNELLAQDIIYPIESEYAHQVVCVSKKNGGIRICVDYRAVNEATKDDAFPMALPQELILQVGRASFITLVDLRRGYWQVPLSEESQKLSAFVTHEGQFAWRVMPFGLKTRLQPSSA